MTQHEINLAIERATVYPSGVSTTCWFSDQYPEDDDNNLQLAFDRIKNEDQLECG